jgi:hypothetical protein
MKIKIVCGKPVELNAVKKGAYSEGYCSGQFDLDVPNFGWSDYEVQQMQWLIREFGKQHMHGGITEPLVHGEMGIGARTQTVT